MIFICFLFFFFNVRTIDNNIQNISLEVLNELERQGKITASIRDEALQHLLTTERGNNVVYF